MSAPRGRIPDLDLDGVAYASRDHLAVALQESGIRLLVVVAALGAVLAASCCLGRRV